MSRPRNSVTKKTRHLTAKARYDKLKKYYSGKFEDTDYFARKMRNLEVELDPLLRQPHADYSSRSEKNMRAVAKSAGIKKRKYLKRIPHPAPNNEDFSVSVKGGRVTVASPFYSETEIEFDMRRLAAGGREYVQSLVAGAGDLDQFQIKAGSHYVKKYGSAHSKRTVADEVAKLQSTYSVGNEVVITNKRGHHEKRIITEDNDYRSWLHGLTKIEVANQAELKTVKKRIQTREKEKIRFAKAATKAARKRKK